MNPLTWFPGYKTYILAIGGFATALGAFLVGEMEMGKFVEVVFEAFVAMTIRKGVG